MSSEIEEMQNEEIEALSSIYEGDENFKQISPKVYQYKYGVDNDPKSFILEISWGPSYPNDLPTINMETFYNSHLISPVKDKITSTVTEEANQWLGCGMTYTLFECLKERIEELMEEQPLEMVKATEDDESKEDSRNESKLGGGGAQKKEQLTKAQKRRQWERSDHEGNRARGWDWVDLVKHLSQGGNREEAGKPPSS